MAAKHRHFEIITPRNPAFAGERAGVRFFDGLATTADEAAARECERLGYVVTDLTEPPRFEVRTPPADSAFTGEKTEQFPGVQFFRGVARTDDAKLADRFEAAGYTVLDVRKLEKAAEKAGAEKK